jgi:hypothetical protein
MKVNEAQGSTCKCKFCDRPIREEDKEMTERLSQGGVVRLCTLDGYTIAFGRISVGYNNVHWDEALGCYGLSLVVKVTQPVVMYENDRYPSDRVKPNERKLIQRLQAICKAHKRKGVLLNGSWRPMTRFETVKAVIVYIDEKGKVVEGEEWARFEVGPYIDSSAQRI